MCRVSDLAIIIASSDIGAVFGARAVTGAVLGAVLGAVISATAVIVL